MPSTARGGLVALLSMLAAIPAAIATTATTASAAGPTPLVATVAGDVSGGDGGVVTSAYGAPSTVAVDPAGNVFVGDGYRIRRIDASSHIVTTVAGATSAGNLSNGDPALSDGLPSANDAVATDGAGHVYLGDGPFVYEVGDDGNLHWRAGASGFQSAFAVGADGSVYQVDGFQIFRYPSGGGARTLVVGTDPNGPANYCDNCTAATASVNPARVAVAPDGTVYFTDGGAIREVALNGMLTTVVTGGVNEPAPPDGVSASAIKVNADSLAVGPDGTQFFADVTTSGAFIYRLLTNGTVQRVGSGDCNLAATATQVLAACGWGVGGVGLSSFAVDGSQAASGGTPLLTSSNDQSPDGTVATAAWFTALQDIDRDAAGRLVLLAGHRIRGVDDGGNLTTLATLATTSVDERVAAAPDGSTYVLEEVGPYTPSDDVVLRVPPGGGAPTVIAGGGSDSAMTAQEPATSVLLRNLTDLAVGPDGTLYLADHNDARVFAVAPDGQFRTLADEGSSDIVWGGSGLIAATGSSITTIGTDGTPSSVSTLNANPFGLGTNSVGVGSDGSVYLANRGGTFDNGTHGNVTRRFPDSRMALAAGALPYAATTQGEGIPAVGAEMHPLRLLVGGDDSMTYAESVGLPALYRVRHVDAGGQPTFPGQPTGFSAASPSAGVVQLTIAPPASGTSECVYTRADHSQQAWDHEVGRTTLYCSGQSASSDVVLDPNGTAHVTVRGLGSQPAYPLAGTYSFLLVPTDSSTGSVGLPAGATADVAPDTTPPGPPTHLVGGYVSSQQVTLTVPADPDFDHLFAKVVQGTTPVTSATGSNDLSWSLPPAGSTTATGYFYGDVFQPYSVTVWAVDLAGNYSSPASVAVPAVAVVPPATTFTATAGVATVALSWTANNGDAVLRMAPGDVAPASASDGVLLHQGSDVASWTHSGLTPGTDYSYSVFMRQNGTDLSAPRSVTVRATRLQLSGATTMTYGGAASIRAVLTRVTGGTGAAAQSVHLLARRHGTTVWSALAAATTDSLGRVTFTVKPAVSTDYTARFTGGRTDIGASSGAATVGVRPRLSVGASRVTAPRGSPITISARVAPNSHGRVVYLQRYYAGAWHTAAHATLTSTSRAAFRLVLKARGKYLYRLFLPPGAGRVAGYSPRLTLTMT